MKKVFLNLFFLCVIGFSFTSCEIEDQITGVPSPITSLDIVSKLYKDAPVTLKATNMLDASYVTGVVISDPNNGNSPDGLVIMQSYRRNQLRGIAFALSNTSTQYNAGDSIVVKIEGGILDRVNGILQISGISESQVEKISTGNTQLVNIVTGTFSTIISSMDVYESTLVQLKSAIATGIVNGQKFVGDITLTDGGSTVKMHTETTASFASEKVPGLGDYTGIIFNGTNPTLWLRSSDDYEVQSLELNDPQALYANFPEGFENIIGDRKGGYTKGTVETYATGEWLMDRCYTLSSSTLVNKTDTYCVMLQSNQIGLLEMNFNLPYGASKLSFDYGVATVGDTALPSAVKVEYSQDAGNTWTQIESDLIVSSLEKYSVEYTLSIIGPVRFRISKDKAEVRLSIDQIAVYQH